MFYALSGDYRYLNVWSHPPGTAYIDLKYSQALTLSTAYQGGVVAWVAFWAIYGAGFGAVAGA